MSEKKIELANKYYILVDELKHHQKKAEMKKQEIYAILREMKLQSIKVDIRI